MEKQEILNINNINWLECTQPTKDKIFWFIYHQLIALLYDIIYDLLPWRLCYCEYLTIPEKLIIKNFYYQYKKVLSYFGNDIKLPVMLCGNYSVKSRDDVLDLVSNSDDFWYIASKYVGMDLVDGSNGIYDKTANEIFDYLDMLWTWTLERLRNFLTNRIKQSDYMIKIKDGVIYDMNVIFHGLPSNPISDIRKGE